ncbi:MAG: MBL fold metallo-hydrolase [Myxococcales bacterium]|nr:MBL fold metallo-hydrolase [Myxococcales bacterium]
MRIVPVRTPTLPPATHTNVYVVGQGELALVDAASPYPEERAALDRWLDERAASGERVVELLLTHHHVDHVSGTAHLAARLGVPVAAHPVTAALLAGRIAVSRTIDEGARLRYGGVELTALFTPGHAPGHLAFFEPRARAVLAGDMVASVGTIIVDPPEGDMRLYLASLERLRALDARWLLPSHGPPVDDPERLLAFYVAHRLQREARVVAALALGAAPVAELVPRAYPDVAPAIWPLAARSLLAHLLKLRDDGRAVDEGDTWRLVDP